VERMGVDNWVKRCMSVIVEGRASRKTWPLNVKVYEVVFRYNLNLCEVREIQLVYILVTPKGAGEDRLHVGPPMTINDSQLLPYPPKEEWWAGVMTKSQIPTIHRVHDSVNQGLQQ